ncbi:MAG: hypothetical protein ACI9FN_000501 [Saprospiraceae bacterium]|jgi:hypothetical protein
MGWFLWCHRECLQSKSCVFYINDEPLGSSFGASDLVCQRRQFYEAWESDTSDIAKNCIITQNENPQGNDFALDDIRMFELESVSYDTTVVMIKSIEETRKRRLYQHNAFSPNNDGFSDLFFLPPGKGGLE